MPTIPGTSDDDPLSGTPDNDVLLGFEGADTLEGEGGDDVLEGGEGADVLAGGTGADTARGGAGNDTFNGDIGAEGEDVGDVLDGGDGRDEFSYWGPGAVTVDLAAGTSSSGATLIRIEDVYGNEADDTLLGDAADNQLRAWRGRDSLSGGAGDDTLDGGPDADALDGGAGFDIASYHYEFADQGVTASLADPSANTGDAAGDTYAGIEGLRGSIRDDSLAAADGGGRLEGMEGNDSLTGGAGADTLAGGAGDDTLDGGAGPDVAVFSGNRGDYTVTLHRDASGEATHVTVADNQADRDGTDTIRLEPSGATVEAMLFADGGVDVICFMPGTLVATPAGEAPVETLGRGDLVLTADGRAAPVLWLGRQTVSRRFADPMRVLPIRIAAGALGEGLPRRDLLLSPDHALLLEGVLVHAGALVNGITVRRETTVPERWTYWHVELADHALVLAEGVAAETFVDNASRFGFDNWAEH